MDENYPLMLFPTVDGKVDRSSPDWMVVADESEEAIAREAGYVALSDEGVVEAEAPTDPAVADEPEAAEEFVDLSADTGIPAGDDEPAPAPAEPTAAMNPLPRRTRARS